MFQYDFPLATLTTFGIKANAKLYTQVRTITDLQKVWQTSEFKSANQVLILGGGSNMLFTKDFDGLVIHNLIKGIAFEDESEQSVLAKAGAGENWHEFVMTCVGRNLGGVENLSLIPGTVGASPVQNIGAYGVELKDVFVSLEAFDMHAGEVVSLNKEQCSFRFVESVISAAVIVLIVRTRRPFFLSPPAKLLAMTTLTTVVVTLAVPFSGLARIFGLAPLDGRSLGAIALIVLTYGIFAEVAKGVFYRTWKQRAVASSRQ